MMAVFPQKRRQPPRKPARPAVPAPVLSPSPTPEPEVEAVPEPTPPEDLQDVLKISTDLVTVPVIATTAAGNYVPDLRQEEFEISEDGVQQQVAFFATVSAPFHVVLVLDTSASTNEKLGMIRRSAIAFVEQLQPGDRVKVISFDDKIRDLSEFTNDRARLRSAINQTESGQGTKLYDAMELALSSTQPIQGRKAIVLFTDGVDWHSDRATFDGTLHWLDEGGALVYAIRYDTRQETELIAREQANDVTPQLPTIDVIRTPPSGTTAPTFPGEDPLPTTGTRERSGPFGLPTAAEIMRRRREDERRRDSERTDGNFPTHRIPDPPRGSENPDRRYPSPSEPGGRTDPNPSRRTRRQDDSISAMLDRLYLTADSYLGALVDKSGGRLVRADTLSSLPDAFAKIAAELRTQYAVGYYPTNKTKDGKYRKIKVGTSRKSVAVRARPGYRAPRD